jgi:hypothetical protein
MDPSVGTARSAGGGKSRLDRVADWLLLEGDRRVVAAGIVLVAALTAGSLVAAGVLAVGPGSSVARLFGSGLTAGVITLLTIALSINQLILSRVFGSPAELYDRLEGSRALRGRVERHAGQPSSSNDPAAFLSLLASTLSERAAEARSLVERTGSHGSVAAALEDIVAYGRSIDQQVEAETSVTRILGVILGPEYAINMTAVRHIENAHRESLPPDAVAELQALGELLEHVAVVRQFFKTLALQRDFAALSRLLVYSGLVALLVSVSLTLVYRTSSVTLPEPSLSLLVPVALAVAVAPLALFAAYILRAATVAHRTVSVGPFVPPEER